MLTIPIEARGSGFAVGEVTPFLSSLNASDVELGYDGRVFFVEYGAGWGPDDKGSVQVAEPLDSGFLEAGREVAQLVKEGFPHRTLSELSSLLRHSDQGYGRKPSLQSYRRVLMEQSHYSPIFYQTPRLESLLHCMLFGGWANSPAQAMRMPRNI